MAQVVNTNVMSLNSQRQLNKSQALGNQAMERLSSGLRINSAKDDAAGLAISTGMQSQIKGINQAVRNANDGVSMSQTAEGSMDEMTNILQRMRELSVQSANDTNSSSNRQSIQKEVDQLHSELDRIAETTEFNGAKLLNGTAGSTTLQIGANEGQTLTFSIDSVSTNALGLNGDLNKADLNGGRVVSAIAESTIDINGVTIGTATDITGNTAQANANVINDKTSETGVMATTYNVVQGASTEAGKAVSGITTGLEIKIGDDATVTLGATSSMSNLVETINRDVGGVTASLDDNGGLLLTNDTGKDITIGGTVDNSGLTAATSTGFIALKSIDGSAISINDKGDPSAGVETLKTGFLVSNGAGTLTTDSTVALDTATVLKEDKIQINGIDLVSTGGTAGELLGAVNALTELTGVTATEVTGGGFVLSSKDGSAIEVTSKADGQAAQATALAKIGMGNEMGGKVIRSLGTNVSTMAGASSAITSIDKALGQISGSRAGLGALQNRLGSTISNLENVSQNLSASNSRIQDADFALETSKMSKAQILQQAGTSMLAQANASAKSVLSLLG
ncbi:adenylate kinase [Psychromonas sp. CNPT3]|uniref:flagellin N-terminal helical domain-containing protein n=1 Tax=Psychromonas sp. CNPT3 TaxID=314282 RepID=UPI00006E34DA|nr:flagellin [Psychromonas sp. CNPT3]AGH82013.1 adenylate kinase [Psychromonas sp. CNPT3]